MMMRPPPPIVLSLLSRGLLFLHFFPPFKNTLKRRAVNSFGFGVCFGNFFSAKGGRKAPNK